MEGQAHHGHRRPQGRGPRVAHQAQEHLGHGGRQVHDARRPQVHGPLLDERPLVGEHGHHPPRGQGRGQDEHRRHQCGLPHRQARDGLAGRPVAGAPVLSDQDAHPQHQSPGEQREHELDLHSQRHRGQRRLPLTRDEHDVDRAGERDQQLLDRQGAGQARELAEERRRSDHHRASIGEGSLGSRWQNCGCVHGNCTIVRRGRLRDFPRMRAACHWHDDLEFIRILAGSMTCYVDGATVAVGPGHGLFVNSCRLHFGYSPDGTDCLFICVLFHPLRLGALSDTVSAIIRPREAARRTARSRTAGSVVYGRTPILPAHQPAASDLARFSPCSSSVCVAVGSATGTDLDAWSDSAVTRVPTFALVGGLVMGLGWRRRCRVRYLWRRGLPRVPISRAASSVGATRTDLEGCWCRASQFRRRDG